MLGHPDFYNHRNKSQLARNQRQFTAWSGSSKLSRHSGTCFEVKSSKVGRKVKVRMIFGKTQAWLYLIEWQKHGLLHCYLLLWLSADPRHRITPDKVDGMICAKFPDPSADPKLHQIVNSNMVHGPCGGINPNSPCNCMQDGQCSKKYPSNTYITETQLGANSYSMYRRHDRDNYGQVCKYVALA